MKIGYSWARFRNIGMTIWVRLKVRYDAMFQNNIIFCGEEYIYVFFHYQIEGYSMFKQTLLNQMVSPEQ